MSNRNNVPIVGRAGVKYGLQLPGKPQAATAAAPAKKLNVFGDDSDDEEDVGQQLARQAARKQSDAKVKEMQQKALEEDPTIFDYDGNYDKDVEAKKNPRLAEKVQRESKYIGLLLQQKVVRDKEQDIAFERRQLKERKQEDHLFEDKEKFVTAAYRKKLEEDKKWQEEQRLRDEQDEQKQAHKVGHMGHFYRNLLTDNVAMGTSKGAAKKPAADEEQDAAADADAEAGPREAAAAAKAKQEGELDRYERMRLEAERALRERKAAAAGAGKSGEGGGSGAEDGVGGGGAGGSAQEPGTAGDAGAGGAAGKAPQAGDRGQEGGEQAEQPPQAAVAAGKRRNDDSSVAEIRARYLARRQKR